MKADKPLTKREIKKAGRLFLLVSMWNAENDGCDGDTDREAMVAEVVHSSEKALLKEFPSLKTIPITQAGIIDAIKGMRK